MSMDLSVWSSRPFDLPEQLPQWEQWKCYQDQWAFEKQGWQVLVLPARPYQTDPPDLPNSAVLLRLPGVSYVAYVTLEPIGADHAGYAFLEKVVRSLAGATGGVWVDPNEEVYAHDEGQFFE
jgi:hypothetical protein